MRPGKARYPSMRRNCFSAMTSDVNEFDYLTKLLRHTEELKQNPWEWMPWSYGDTLARLATSVAA